MGKPCSETWWITTEPDVNHNITLIEVTCIQEQHEEGRHGGTLLGYVNDRRVEATVSW